MTDNTFAIGFMIWIISTIILLCILIFIACISPPEENP